MIAQSQDKTSPPPTLELDGAAALWSRITRPHHSITTPDGKRHARLLAGMSSVLFLIGSVFIIYLFLDGVFRLDDSDEPIILAALLALPFVYVLTKTGRYRAGSVILIAMTFIASVLTPFLEDASVGMLGLAVLPILLTAYFFQARVVVLVLAAVIGLAGWQWSTTALDPDMNFIALLLLQFTALIGIAIIVFKLHLQAIERDRRVELEHIIDKRTLELRIAKQEAEAARDHALEADRAKSQFLASMSHELRTPLNAILTFNELISMGTLGPVNGDQVDYLQKSVQSGRHLLSLINDVLDITKIHSGMMKLFIEEDFDVASEIDAIVTSARNLLHDKPVELIVDLDADFPPLTCDKRRVRQVLLNLMSNAVKFTETGSITLQARQDEQSVLFALIDTGPGIPPDQQELIFEPFVQTETGLKHAGGTGLGLPISKRLVEAHAGQLWLESEPGQGAAFYVKIPMQPPVALGEQEMKLA